MGSCRRGATSTRPSWLSGGCRDGKSLAGGLRAVIAGMRRRLGQGPVPLVQIAGLGRTLHWVHRAARLVRAEHRTAPAAGADRLAAALACLMDGGVVAHGGRSSYR